MRSRSSSLRIVCMTAWYCAGGWTHAHTACRSWSGSTMDCTVALALRTVAMPYRASLCLWPSRMVATALHTTVHNATRTERVDVRAEQLFSTQQCGFKQYDEILSIVQCAAWEALIRFAARLQFTSQDETCRLGKEATCPGEIGSPDLGALVARRMHDTSTPAPRINGTTPAAPVWRCIEMIFVSEPLW